MTSPLQVAGTGSSGSFGRQAISSEVNPSTKIGTDAPALTVATIAVPALSVTRICIEQPLVGFPVFLITTNPLNSKLVLLVK